MKAPLCISQNPDHTGFWRQAFPEGKLISRSDGIRVDPEQLIWFVLNPGSASEQLDFRSFMANYPQARCICLSPIPSDEEALQSMQLGARGYSHLYVSAATLWQIADVVNLGGLWVSRDIMARMLKTLAPEIRQVTEVPPTFSLTGRETEVARAICNGLTNREIADQLSVSERTIKSHLTSLFEKTGARDRLQLAIKLAPSFTKG
ncbi:MAG: response regulator transcription factor [Hahellaceae bacterium]|jgi:two-component system nitrate/nitrite response regulator NarL|nr:response regulator transcription factor [Hahellaceae bacterium]